MIFFAGFFSLLVTMFFVIVNFLLIKDFGFSSQNKKTNVVITFTIVHSLMIIWWGYFGYACYMSVMESV